MARFDQLRLHDWSVQVAIGAWENEQGGTQELVLDVALRGRWRKAARTDSLQDALDYAELREACELWLGSRRWVLLETFTWDLCGFFLTKKGVNEVEATVWKPAAQAPVRISCTMLRRK